ncbi:hypothetical protein [Pseudocolwellia agarivorans]|uniref:hypothetical protein n=1 Tax=Pseudocolwellia agarivorans TaxID=1911682 RepID=UPI003F88168C
MGKLLILCLNLIVFNSFACSFAPVFDEFITTDVALIKASSPRFSLESIHRGTDDGNHGSCSDLGIIKLKIDTIPVHEQGYIFKIVKGRFEDQLFLDSPVVLSKFIQNKQLYSFMWFDGSNEVQEPINITIQITAVSLSGDKSEPQVLNISHPGTSKPWWKVW